MLKRSLRRISLSLDLVTQVAVILLTMVLVVTVVAGVYFRYVLRSPLTGSFELARYVMVWSVLLSSGLAVRRKAHIGMPIVVEVMPPRIQWFMKTAAILVTVLFLCALLYFGWNHALHVFPQRSPTLRISMTWPFLALPVGAAIMLIQYVSVLIGAVERDSVDDKGQNHQRITGV